ncbi:MAG: DnaJ domain-containing protein [Luteitalea sp.]|nr:DnaJ domain-containing protein [Luteitalea sp.]
MARLKPRPTWVRSAGPSAFALRASADSPPRPARGGPLASPGLSGPDGTRPGAEAVRPRVALHRSVMELYAILGVTADATLPDVQRAYRRLARRYHPNINPGDQDAAARFRAVALAYEILSDPKQRREYDQKGDAMLAEAGGITFAFERFDFTASAEGPAASTFGELFADLFRPPRERSGRAERGADLHADIAVPFETAAEGGRHSVTTTRHDVCDTCFGAGRMAVPEAVCPKCAGEGVVRGARGHMVFSKTCPQCHGDGRRQAVGCSTCHGEGVVMRGQAIDVVVSPGVADGDEITLSGQGHAGRFGGPRGDLRVRVHVAPHHMFRRDGDDLLLELPVGVHEAALGARVEVPTPYGAATLRIPPGTQGGQQFRLRERGLPSLRRGRRGDLVVQIRLVLPPLVDERARALMRELASIWTEDVRKG